MYCLLTSGIQLHSDLKDFTTDELKAFGRVLQLYGQSQDIRFRTTWEGQAAFVTIATDKIQFIALTQQECEAIDLALNPPEAPAEPIGDGPVEPPLATQ